MSARECIRMERKVDIALIDMFDGESVEERVEDGAQVEEGVCHREEGDVAPEVGGSPLGLWHSCHHEATDLVGKPAQRQGSHNET
uniref:Uncharacterized protein n=1 Tax=Oryzias latipes TaxID=8090 RepID=A0A3P9K5N8_ORYLA